MIEILKHVMTWQTLVGVILLFFWFLLGDIYEAKNKSKQPVITLLKRSNWTDMYNSMITGALDWVDKRLSPELSRSANPSEKNSLHVAWSAGALGLSVALAVAYPLLSLIIQWFWLGNEVSMGGNTIIPAEPIATRRFLAVLALFFLFITVYKAEVAKTSRDAIVLWLISVALTAILAILAVNSLGSSGVTVAFLAVVCIGALAGSMAVAPPVAGAFAIAVATSGVLTFALVGVIEGVMSLAIAGAFAVAFAVSANLSVRFAVGLAIAASALVIASIFLDDFINWMRVLMLTFILFVVGTLALVQKVLGDHWGRPGITLTGFVLLLLLVLYFTIDQVDTIEVGTSIDGRGVLFFLGVLPLLNGLTDFLSIGATRFFLRRAETSRQFWVRSVLWIGDIAIATIALIVLIVAIVVFVTLSIPADGVPLIDFKQTIADIRAQPERYFWLGFILASTLIPTIIHLMVVCFSFFLYIPIQPRLLIINWIEKGREGDRVKGRLAALFLTALCTLSLWIPLYGLFRLSHWLWSHSDFLINFVLRWADRLHTVLLPFA